MWSERTGIEIDFRPGHWDETLRMVRDGEVEAHAGLFYNEQRARYLEYGSYLTNSETHYFIKKGLPPVDNVEDLAAYRVGVLAGDYVEGFLAERLPEGTVIGFESYDAIMDALHDGQLQVFAADSPTGIYHLQKAGLGFGFEYPEQTPLYQTDWLVVAAKGNKELIEIFNLGLATISEDERRAIERRWVAVEAKGFELSRRDIAIVAAILAAVVVLGILVWNFSLKRQIALRTEELKADIAKREEVEAALSESEARFAEAAQQAHLGHWVYDEVADRLSYCSDEMSHIHGITPEAYLDLVSSTENNIKRVHPDDREHYGAVIKDAKRNEMDYGVEFRIVRADGAVRHLRELGTPETDAAGQLVRSRGTIQDITDRKQAEEDLRAANEASAAAQTRLLDAIENLPAAFVLYDSEDRLLLCNGKFRDLYGYSEEEAIAGASYGDLFKLDVERGNISADADADDYHRRRVTLRRKYLGAFEFQFANGRWLEMHEHATSEGGLVSIQVDITHRKQAAQDLAAKEAQLRLTLDNMPGGIRLADKDRRYVFFNSRYSELYEFPEGLLKVGESVRVENLHQAKRGDLDPGDPDALTDEWLAALPVATEPQSWERTTVDGKILQVSTSPTPEGGVVNIVTDITERKAAERALRESEERHALAIEGANDGLWDWNIESSEIHVSPHARELLGLEGGAATTTPEDWNARVHPEDHARRLEIEEAHLRGETEYYTDEYRVRGADGTYHWVLDRGACLRDDEGRAYRMAGSLGDITERKQGEQFLRTVVDTIPAALNIRDAEGRYVLINRRLADYFGVDAAIAKGTYPNEAFPGFEIEDDQFRQVLITGMPVVDSEIRYDGPDGADEYWLATRKPILDDNGQIQYVLTVSSDITDRKQAEQELANKEAQLRIAMDNMPGGIMLTDRDLKYMLFNSKCPSGDFMSRMNRLSGGPS